MAVILTFNFKTYLSAIAGTGAGFGGLDPNLAICWNKNFFPLIMYEKPLKYCIHIQTITIIPREIPLISYNLKSFNIVINVVLM